MATIDTFQGCTCASECREKLEELARLREANANNMEAWSQNVAGLNRENARLREERGRLEIEIAKWEENVAGLLRQIARLREENERLKEMMQLEEPMTMVWQAERERDEARALLKRIMLSDARLGGDIRAEVVALVHGLDKPDPGVHLDPDQWNPGHTP